jgi:hypothetical protein
VTGAINPGTVNLPPESSTVPSGFQFGADPVSVPLARRRPAGSSDGSSFAEPGGQRDVEVSVEGERRVATLDRDLSVRADTRVAGCDRGALDVHDAC